MKLYTFKSNIIYNKRNISLSDAHLFEHLLCRNLVSFNCTGVHGITFKDRVLLLWSDTSKKNSLIQALEAQPDLQTLEEEERIIEIECNWLDRGFNVNSSVNHLPTWWRTCIGSIASKEICITELNVNDIQKQFLALLNRTVESLCSNNVPVYFKSLDPNLINSEFKFDYCSAIPIDSDSVISGIHDWYWFLSGFCSYSSAFSQFLRSRIQSIYSYQVGLFPFNGKWYLFASGLHLMSSRDFVKTISELLMHFISQSALVIDDINRECYHSAALKMNYFINNPIKLKSLLFNLNIKKEQCFSITNPLDNLNGFDVKKFIYRLIRMLEHDL